MKAFLKEIGDLHSGQPGAARTAKMINTMRRDPSLPVTHFLAMLDNEANEALYNNVRTRLDDGLLVRIWNPTEQQQFNRWSSPSAQHISEDFNEVEEDGSYKFKDEETSQSE